MKILITGASGFIGRAVLLAIKEIDGWEPSVVLRRPDNDPVFAGVAAVRAHIDENFEWPVSSDKFDCVIHCAGRAHVINEAAVDPLSEFRKVNLAGTIAIAKAAAAAGVRRFVFLSSIGVNGSATNLNAFDENSLPAPAANYALSKLEAEQALLALQAETSMEVVIIRPPLVYAANAPGNFQRLLRLVRSRAPLPFAGVKNKRSMVALENLVDFILRCVVHPVAANEQRRLGQATEHAAPVKAHRLCPPAQHIGRAGSIDRTTGDHTNRRVCRRGSERAQRGGQQLAIIIRKAQPFTPRLAGPQIARPAGIAKIHLQMHQGKLVGIGFHQAYQPVVTVLIDDDYLEVGRVHL